MKLQKMPAGARAFSLPPKGPGNEVEEGTVTGFCIWSIYVSIGNSMVSTAIWEKHIQASFSKTRQNSVIVDAQTCCGFS